MTSIASGTRLGSIVGGEVRRDGPVLISTNPARTDEVVAEVALGDASTFVDAARAARAAQREWAKVPAPARGRAIPRDGARREAEQLALARGVSQ
jgi:aldehyde dehydrogenase (NAD+)